MGFDPYEPQQRAMLRSAIQAAGISIEETRRVLKISRHPISLDRPVGESEDSFFGEFIEDDACESPVSAATQRYSAVAGTMSRGYPDPDSAPRGDGS